MQFPEELLPHLVPKGTPPDRYAIGRVQGLSEDIRDPLLRRSYLWANALTIAALEASSRFSGKLSGVSAGLVFLPPSQQEHPIQIAKGFSFGVEFFFSSEEAREGDVFLLAVGGRAFPAVITYGTYEAHGLPAHPAGGTGTCWIRSTTTPAWSYGVLTCRHTLASMPLGSSVSFHASARHAHPTRGYLADIDACTIDAAVVAIRPGDWPSGVSPLPICHAVAPGQSVSFQGRRTYGSGTVLRVLQYPDYLGNLIGQRVISDCFGGPGDSGSLLIDNNTGMGVGIYMGSVPDARGNDTGLFQHLSQASAFFGFSTHL